MFTWYFVKPSPWSRGGQLYFGLRATLETNLVYAGHYKYYKDLFNLIAEMKLTFSIAFS